MSTQVQVRKERDDHKVRRTKLYENGSTNPAKELSGLSLMQMTSKPCVLTFLKKRLLQARKSHILPAGTGFWSSDSFNHLPHMRAYTFKGRLQQGVSARVHVYYGNYVSNFTRPRIHVCALKT